MDDTIGKPGVCIATVVPAPEYDPKRESTAELRALGAERMGEIETDVCSTVGVSADEGLPDVYVEDSGVGGGVNSDCKAFDSSTSATCSTSSLDSFLFFESGDDGGESSCV